MGLVGGAADLGQQPAHDRRGGCLRLRGRVDVDGVAGADELRRRRSSGPGLRRGRVRCCRPAGRRRRRRRSRTAPAPRCSAARARFPNASLEQRWSSSRIPASSSSWRITQSTTGLHVAAVHGGGVQHRRQQRLRAVGPVRAVGRPGADVRRSSPARSAAPRPTTATPPPVTSAALPAAPAAGPGRVKHPHPTVAGPDPAGRAPHVGLGRGRDRRPGVREQRRDDHPARLARPRRPEQQHRPLSPRDTATPRARSARDTPRRRAGRAAARTAVNGSTGTSASTAAAEHRREQPAAAPGRAAPASGEHDQDRDPPAIVAVLSPAQRPLQQPVNRDQR